MLAFLLAVAGLLAVCQAVHSAFKAMDDRDMQAWLEGYRRECRKGGLK